MSEGGGSAKVSVRVLSAQQKTEAAGKLATTATTGRINTAVEVRQYLISIGKLMGMGDKEYVPVDGLVAVFHLYEGAKQLRSEDPSPFRCMDMGCQMASLYDVGFRVRSHATMPDGSTYSAMGDACPHNTTRITRDALQRMAETRANGRVLRLATNSGMTCLEELHENDWSKAAKIGSNAKPAKATDSTATPAAATPAAGTAATAAPASTGLSGPARQILDMLQRLGINRPGDQLRVVRAKFTGCRSVQDMNPQQLGGLVDYLQNCLDDLEAKSLFLSWYNGIPA